MRSLDGANAAAVLQRLNPIIRGWSAYFDASRQDQCGNNGCETPDRRSPPGKSPIAGSKRRTGCNSVLRKDRRSNAAVLPDWPGTTSRRSVRPSRAS
ncbi:group II intron maturase-specific domain-containing protein [Streptomyces lincolnensis]|uniref:group II intron maturase-specific domain-containing protein n=1 Tax=Streptomyces lincolnensis TaxID=1915 RepID=UPI0035ABDCC3